MQPAPDQGPASVLAASHRQIETALETMRALAKASAGGALADERKFKACLWFCRHIITEHSVAEEELVFPALRRAAVSGAANPRRLLDTLEEEHGCADRAHLEADRLGEAWLKDRALTLGETTRLIEVLDGLADLYTRHIALEETQVFPLLETGLAGPELEQLGAELTRRRLLVRDSAALLWKPEPS